MNLSLERLNRGTATAIGFLMVSVIFAVIAVGLKFSQAVPAVDAGRGAERAKALAQIRAAEDAALNTAAVIDEAHGTVRLPIDTAMKMAAHAWQNPAAARADLNARAEKATKELPKAPEKPSAFE
jgi:hypothetical protein